MNSHAGAMTAHNISADPKFQDALRQIFEESIPFCRLLGLKLHFGEAGLDMSMERKPFMLGNWMAGRLHGGVIASILDSLAGAAVFYRLAQLHPRRTVAEQIADFDRLATIDLRVDYLLPAKADAFRASSRVTRLGRNVASVTLELRDDAQNLIATGAAAFVIRPDAA